MTPEELVVELKQKTDELIQLCFDNHSQEAPPNSEMNRRWMQAQNYYEMGFMWASRAATTVGPDEGVR